MTQLDLKEDTVEEENRLWKDYKENRDDQSRDQLIALYMPYAKKIATYIYSRRTSNDVEYMDYYHYGLLGLMEAVERFDPCRDIEFRTYSSYRIKGEIYSGLVKQTEKRQFSEYCKKLNDQRKHSILSQIESMKSLEEVVDLTVNLAVVHIMDELRDLKSDTVLVEGRIYEDNEYYFLKKQIKSSVESLPAREKMVVKHHYYNHLLFENIAEIMEVSKSRISQIHKNAINMIRRSYSKELDVSY